MSTVAVWLIASSLLAAPGTTPSEEPGAPKLSTDDPARRASIAHLEKAHASHPLPAILLSIAELYEDWPGHCKEALDTYQRFFADCDKCQAQSYGVTRFEKLIERCVVSIDDEVAIREKVSVPRTMAPQRQPADATPKELADVFRLARKVDDAAAVRGLLTLIEAGKSADVKLLNELRLSAWTVLRQKDADAEQVKLLLHRIQKVAPDVYSELSVRSTTAGNNPAVLNGIRDRAIDVLTANSSGLPKRGIEIASCRANDEREWGRITVSTQPWSEVFLNGTKVGSTPVHKVDALAGCVTIRAFAPSSGREIVKNVTIRPNKNAILRIDLDTGVDSVRYE